MTSQIYILQSNPGGFKRIFKKKEEKNKFIFSCQNSHLYDSNINALLYMLMLTFRKCNKKATLKKKHTN